MAVIEYFRTDQGFVRREIEPMFATIRVHIGPTPIYEMRRLNRNREIPGTRKLLAESELPPILKASQ